MYKITIYKSDSFIPTTRYEKSEWYTKNPLVASEINDYLTRGFTIQISPIIQIKEKKCVCDSVKNTVCGFHMLYPNKVLVETCVIS